MKVMLAEKSGFCFGVKRALEEALKTKDAFTLGPLIHNASVIKELEKQGIKVIDSIDEIEKGTLVIRTHGVPRKIIEKAKEKGLKVIDLTCPFVKKVQDVAIKAENEGYKIIVVGEKEHPEVKGIIGNLKNFEVIKSPGEKKEKYDKICVVAQTTQILDNFKKTVEKLKKNSKEIRVMNTICHSTTDIQNSAVELAKKVDLMVVVGGRNSGNTKRLKELCAKIVETKQIETENDLQKDWFKEKETIGISAGASTPAYTIERVKETIENGFS